MATIVVLGLWTRYPSKLTDTNFTIQAPDGSSASGYAANLASAGAALASAGEQWHAGSRTTKSLDIAEYGNTGYSMLLFAQ